MSEKLEQGQEEYLPAWSLRGMEGQTCGCFCSAIIWEKDSTMLLGWRGLGSHLLVELHAFRGGAFLGVQKEPEEEDGSSSQSSSLSLSNYQLFQLRPGVVVVVPEVHGEPVGICCESASSQESSSAVNVSRMGGSNSAPEEEDIRTLERGYPILDTRISIHPPSCVCRASATPPEY